MFQKSLLKNFIKSFKRSDDNLLIKFVTKDKFIAEDANGAEFIILLSEFLHWSNCVREVKNDTDMKKADAVVYDKSENPIAIVELKSSDKNIANRDIIAQAFRYKNEKPTCKYVIISNFKQLDIYSESSEVCHSIDMTTSSQSSYEELYALLNQYSLETHEIQRLKKNSKSQDEITKEIYKEYSAFRLKLLNNLIENNPNLSREEVFESANKLLDRYMFILFAEDRGLIPANSIDAIINKYKNDKKWGENRPLYDYYKKYFDYIDVGNVEINIPKYNGNLFKPDAELEQLHIDNHIIKADLSSLSAYDFSDDVDVEVLGHIFEQSLNDLEKIKESLFTEHKIVNTRKKDGVFYTPKFVTEYIINNTVAKLCEEKKEGLKLFKELKDTKKNNENRRDALQDYITYLNSLKIVDPACGSGAFLTACFRYLLGEHKWTQKELAKAGAGLFENHDIDKQIIENNLFGVDINSASVGIAKLSLWLQTAKRNRPLSDLMENIKCANSLLANWDELFPNIINNGGFDCVIGNPPYFNIQTLGAKSKVAREIQVIYPHIWQDKSDILFYFIAKAIEITKNKVGFITSNAFLHSAKAVKLRNYILENAPISKVVNFEKYMVFEDASITSAIIELDKNKSDSECLAYSFKEKNYDVNEINDVITNINNYFEVSLKRDDVFALVEKKVSALNNKIDSGSQKLNTIFKIGKGMETAADKIFLFKTYPSKFPKKFIKPRVTGKNIEKYIIKKSETYILYFEDIEKFEDLPSAIQNYLLENKIFLENRATVKNEGRIWWRYSRPMHKELYHHNKIFCSRRAFDNTFVIDCDNEYLAFSNMTTIFDTNDNFDLKYLLALLNSKVLNFRYKSIGKQTGGGSFEYFPNGVGKLPIPNIPKEQQKPFINLVNTIIDSKEKIVKYSKHFESLNAIDKIEIKEEVEKLETLVETSVATIDQMVYALYELSADEIALVEGRKP